MGLLWLHIALHMISKVLYIIFFCLFSHYFLDNTNILSIMQTNVWVVKHSIVNTNILLSQQNSIVVTND